MSMCWIGVVSSSFLVGMVAIQSIAVLHPEVARRVKLPWKCGRNCGSLWALHISPYTLIPLFGKEMAYKLVYTHKNCKPIKLVSLNLQDRLSCRKRLHPHSCYPRQLGRQKMMGRRVYGVPSRLFQFEKACARASSSAAGSAIRPRRTAPCPAASDCSARASR